MKRTIKGIRADIGFTQEEMAKYLGISTVSYSLKEKGKREFTASELLAIARKANISANDIILNY